ncbi:SpoIIE family protein phosphatase [bacterium]|nr:SpoIIE family protein phosphatase [bacterium]
MAVHHSVSSRINTIKRKKLKLESNNVLILYSDGIIEAEKDSMKSTITTALRQYSICISIS